MPDTVKYGISNFTLIGALFNALSSDEIEGRPKCALIKNSFCPGNCFIRHMIQSLSGTYSTLPVEVLNDGESASAGTGMIISTLLAVERRLKLDLAFTVYSTREWE